MSRVPVIDSGGTPTPNNSCQQPFSGAVWIGREAPPFSERQVPTPIHDEIVRRPQNAASFVSLAVVRIVESIETFDAGIPEKSGAASTPNVIRRSLLCVGYFHVKSVCERMAQNDLQSVVPVVRSILNPGDRLESRVRTSS